jgi:trigger factor
VPSTVEQLSPTRVKITVEVPFTELKPSMDKTYREIARSVNIPGFRRGKVPPLVIDQRVGRGAVIQEALNDALPRLYGQAVSDNHLAPLAQPEVEVTRLEDGDLLEFTAEVDVRPEFELPDFSTLSATVDEAEVSEEDVDERLEVLRQRFGSQIAVDRPAQEGDIVTLDLLATKDGDPLPDATATDLDYTIGSGSMLEGLDEAVTGLSAGDTANFTSTLVGGPLQGTEADISATISKVQEQELPALDDDFAQQASEFDTMEEVRADFRSSLQNLARVEQANRARDAVLEDLISKVDLDIPDNLRAADLQSRKDSIISQLDAAGLSMASYLAESGEAETEEEFWADLENRSAEALRAQIILDKVAEERELGADQNDLTQHIIRRAQRDGSTPQQIADHLQEHPHHIDEYVQEIRRGKALSLIVNAATVTDTVGNPVDVSAGADDTLLPPGSEIESAETGDPVAAAGSESAETGDPAAAAESAATAPALDAE